MSGAQIRYKKQQQRVVVWYKKIPHSVTFVRVQSLTGWLVKLSKHRFYSNLSDDFLEIRHVIIHFFDDFLKIRHAIIHLFNIG